MKKNNISICLTPDLFHNYVTKNSIVVVVDILRATSVISTAFEYGIKHIIPVRTLEEALEYQNNTDHILAAERNTKIVSGFKFGNSPYHYVNHNIKDKILVLTTTNGTKAIYIANNKNNIVVTGSYINIIALKRYLIRSKKDIIILCSGWKKLINLEDSIFAGKLANILLETNKFTSNCDSLNISKELFRNSEKDIFQYLNTSAYRRRNTSEELIKDTKYCLQPDIKSNIVPVFKKNKLIKMSIK